MDMTVVKQIGLKTYTFTLSGKNLHEVVMEMEKLSFPDKIEACGKCQGKALALRAYVTKEEGYKYVKIQCLNPDCKADLTFGQVKASPDTFYLRKNEAKELDWQPYKAPANKA